MQLALLIVLRLQSVLDRWRQDVPEYGMHIFLVIKENNPPPPLQWGQKDVADSEMWPFEGCDEM